MNLPEGNRPRVGDFKSHQRSSIRRETETGRFRNWELNLVTRRLGIPDLDGAVLARGGNGSPVGMDRDVADPRGMSQPNAALLACGDIPEPDRLVTVR